MQSQTWKVLVKEGNRCFEREEWPQAQRYYYLALDILAKQCSRYPACTATLMAWIGVCHNLADLHEKQTQLQLALKYVELPFQYCQFQAKHSDNEEAKVAALGSMNLTWSALLAFKKKYPGLDEEILPGLVIPLSPIFHSTLVH